MKRVVCAGWMVLLAPLAMAQTAPVDGVVVRVDPASITVKQQDGSRLTAAVSGATQVSILGRKGVGDLKVGMFVGAQALAGPDGAMRAQEVHVLDAAAVSPHGPDAGGTIDATILKAAPAAGGVALTLAWPGGQQVLVVRAETPVLAMQRGTMADVRPGRAVSLIERGNASPPAVAVILLGRDAGKPPL